MRIQNNTCKRRFHNSYGEFPFADNKKLACSSSINTEMLLTFTTQIRDIRLFYNCFDFITRVMSIHICEFATVNYLASCSHLIQCCSTSWKKAGFNNTCEGCRLTWSKNKTITRSTPFEIIFYIFLYELITKIYQRKYRKREHPFGMRAKFSKKLLFPNPWYALVGVPIRG